MAEQRGPHYDRLALAALLALGALFYLRLPGGRLPPAERLAGPPARAYHGESLAPGSVSACGACHGSAPHGRTPGTRAFLNLHTRSLGCGVCHLSGQGLTVRRPTGQGALIGLGREGSGGWKAVDAPEAGVEFRPSGPRCSECHRRGSPLLSSGLFDDYQRRMLEELELLYRLREGRP